MTSLLLAALIVTAESRAMQPGELVVVTVAASPQTEAVRVRAFGRDVPGFRVDERRWRALVGIDLETGPGTYPVSAETVVGGAVADRGVHELHVRARRFPTRRLQVDEAFVNPPGSAEARIKQEGLELEALWATTSPERYWSGPFIRPVPGPANSQFGTRSVFNGVPRSPHGGGDFLSPAGTPIKAPNAGRVVLARDLYYSGNTVVIDHGFGLYSLLAHLSTMTVHEGDRVAAGALVGEVGATGRVTGPHLHWAIRVAGARVDPVSVLTLIGAGGER